jgi:hypothetical protein
MSLIPTMVILLGIVIAFWTASNPGILQNGIEIIISIVQTVRTLLFTLGNLGSDITPWIFPTFAALVSILLLSLTIVWARRIVPAPGPARV